jgi:3-oxoadipate enol-lactonase
MSNLDVAVSGTGAPLVLLHSLLQDRSSFAGIAKRLSRQRKIFNINMPGFGASPAAAPLDGYADCIAEAFDKHGIAPDADVCGNGLGGFVGLTLALRHGKKFNRLVLIGSALRFPDAGRATFRAMADRAEAEGMAALADQAMLRMFSADYLSTHKEQMASVRENFLSINAQVFAAACRALADLDLTPDIARIKNPVLVVVGEDDAATGAALGQGLVKALPDGKIVVLKGAGHAPHMQDPDALIRAITPFLDLKG